MVTHLMLPFLIAVELMRTSAEGLINTRRTLVGIFVDELVIVMKIPISLNSWTFMLG